MKSCWIIETTHKLSNSSIRLYYSTKSCYTYYAVNKEVATYYTLLGYNVY